MGEAESVSGVLRFRVQGVSRVCTRRVKSLKGF